MSSEKSSLVRSTPSPPPSDGAYNGAMQGAPIQEYEKSAAATPTSQGSSGDNVAVRVTGTARHLDSDQFIMFISYKSRFWIVFVFSLLACIQCIEWNTWGPISASVGSVYPQWTSSTVAMMSNWGTITFVLFVFPLSWVAQNKGLRVGVLICGGLVAAGTALRCITRDAVWFTVSCHICAILVGTAGTLVMAAPPLIAATWFPPKQRITAVAVMQVANQLGNLGAYLEPLIVKEPNDGASTEEIKDDIARLMYIAAGASGVLFLMMLVYFPSKPPTPPSISSTVERVDFKTTMRKMLRNKNLILVVLSYSMSYGPTSSWLSVINYSLYDIHYDQNEAMWIGILTVCISGLVALIIGRMTDIIYGHIKITLIGLMFLSTAFYYWFFLITYGTIPPIKWQVYTSVIVGVSLTFASTPLFFELAVELAYPLPEGVVAGLATGLLNAVGIIFLGAFLFQSIGYAWVTYVLIGSSAASAIPLLFVTENYTRSNIDRGYGQSPYQTI